MEKKKKKKNYLIDTSLLHENVLNLKKRERKITNETNTNEKTHDVLDKHE